MSRIVAGILLAVAVLLIAPARLAYGLVLGDAELGSSIGQPLHVWIPYRAGPGESINAACVRLVGGAPFPTANIPVTVNARLGLQSQGGKDYITVESAEPVANRIVRLIVEVKCGRSIALTQEYMLLLYVPERSTEPVAPRPNPVSGEGRPAVSTITKPQPSPPVAIPPRPSPSAAAPSLSPAPSPPTVPARPRSEPPAVPAKASGAVVMPEAPKAPAIARNSPPPQTDNVRPVLRIDPARGKEKIAAAGGKDACCFRLTYELMNGAPPLSETERERLRQDLRDRSSEQVPLSRVQALRDETATLQAQLAASAKALENAEARAARGYMSYAALAAAALMLALGAWFWLRRRLRPGPLAPGNIDLNAGNLGKTEVQVPVAAHFAPAGPAPVAVTAAPAPAEAIDDATISIRAEERIAPTTPVADAAVAEGSTRLNFDFSRPAAVPAPALHPADIGVAPPDLEPDPALRAMEYKNAYIAARFPEIAAGNIVLDDYASVIEGARIFYQDDQDAAKAVELLRVALTTHPEHGGLWLAFFEILWLERAAPEFADLAQRYLARGDGRADSNWPMIAKLGRELDPGNALYSADGLPETGDSSPNWLSAELDMMGDVLALELRTQVLELRDAALAGS